MFLTLLAFIIVLGVIIFVHELGHFLAAKLVGVRVETFSLGFPPKMISKKVGDTEYVLAWLPLGGYVKMAGMIDESLENKPLTGAPWEFMSKNFWQKIFVISAGVIMNLLLGLILFIVLTWTVGVLQGTDQPAVGYVLPNSPAAKAGLQSGDKIVAINGDSISTWNDLTNYVHANPCRKLAVQWQGYREEFQIKILRNAEKTKNWKVSSQGDSLLTWVQLQKIIQPGRETGLQTEWQRSFSTFTREIVPKPQIIPRADSSVVIGLIGINPELQFRKAGLLESCSRGFKSTAFILTESLKMLKRMIFGQANMKEVAGPIGIAQISGESIRYGIPTFIAFIAQVSISIGLLNIFPFPVLDGGHIVFISIEAIIRRPISSKVKLNIQKVGLALILAFFLFISYHDILRLVLGK